MMIIIFWEMIEPHGVISQKMIIIKKKLPAQISGYYTSK
jgi:hypothetical protein